MEGTTMRKPWTGRLGRVGLLAAMLVALVVPVTLVLTQRDGGNSVVGTSDIPTLPSVTIPEVPEPVDPGTLDDGWYLVLYTEVVTMDDALLLQAAREATIEARGFGYGDAKIVRNLGVEGKCDEGGCFQGSPAVGYDVLLKGPYSVPNWSDSDADLDAKYDWHQTTLGQERSEAAARGLRIVPSLHLFTFPDG